MCYSEQQNADTFRALLPNSAVFPPQAQHQSITDSVPIDPPPSRHSVRLSASLQHRQTNDDRIFKESYLVSIATRISASDCLPTVIYLKTTTCIWVSFWAAVWTVSAWRITADLHEILSWLFRLRLMESVTHWLQLCSYVTGFQFMFRVMLIT